MAIHAAHQKNREELASRMATIVAEKVVANAKFNPERLTDSEWENIAWNARGKSMPSTTTRALTLAIVERMIESRNKFFAVEKAAAALSAQVDESREFCHSRFNENTGEVEFD